MKHFKNQIIESIKLKEKLFLLKNDIKKAIDLLSKTLEKKNKILICGNGGSAADAQHLSAEFLVRLRPHINRRPYPVISLAMDTSTITACANDYDFKHLFARNLQALGSKGDLLICISTSGNSKNILEVLKMAKKLKINTLNLLGNNGGKAKKYSKNNIIIKSKNTARIQEMHIFLGHFIFESVENKLLDRKSI